MCGEGERNGMGRERERERERDSSYQLRVPVTTDRFLTALREEGDCNHAHFTAPLYQQVRI